MLSTTVLPTTLHAVAGVPELLVFTVVYPAITALFPVAVFWLARRVLSLRWAFAAAALILTQATFGQELPAIARQEIALMFFVALRRGDAGPPTSAGTRSGHWPPCSPQP